MRMPFFGRHGGGHHNMPIRAQAAAGMRRAPVPSPVVQSQTADSLQKAAGGPPKPAVKPSSMSNSNPQLGL